MSINNRYWRWNVNPTWENYSSLQQEAHLSIFSINEFLKYHHLKAALYFGVGTIESFLNESMRQKLTEDKIEESDIYEKLRKPRLRDKVTKWPAELSEKPIKISEELLEIIFIYASLRNEITHPKEKDHSIYKKFDELNIKELTLVISNYIVNVLEGQNKTFPYWLLGWNFIGMNGRQHWPCLNNNQQFMFALQAFGFKVPARDYYKAVAWEKENMGTIIGFNKLKNEFGKLNRCQPVSKEFPQAPRLCKQWWDLEHIKNCGK